MDQVINRSVLLLVLCLPLICGLTTIAGARHLVRAQLRFHACPGDELPKPSPRAVMFYRVLGVLMMVLCYGILLLGVLATLHS